MAEVNSRSDEHWCTTENVQDHLKIPDKGSARDFESAITSATNSVQAWWKQETGKSSLPDAGTLDDLLQEATAWLAVSEASFSYSRNFGGDGGDSGRTRTAEDKANKKFNEWTNLNDVNDGDSDAVDDTADTTSRNGSLIDEF